MTMSLSRAARPVKLIRTSKLFRIYGTIAGFTGTGTGEPATSDKLDLRDIDFASSQFATSYENNVLTVTDGSHAAHINIVGSYTLENFHFTSDGSGGTLVTDPPAPLDMSADTPKCLSGEFLNRMNHL